MEGKMHSISLKDRTSNKLIRNKTYSGDVAQQAATLK